MFLALSSDLHHFRSWREGGRGDRFCDRFGLNPFLFPLLPALLHLLITQTGASRNHLAISSSISLAGPSRRPRNFLDAHLMTISSLAHLHFLEMQICSASQRETTLPAVPGNYALVTWQEHECWMATASFKLQPVWIQELFVCLSQHGDPSRWKFCPLVLASPACLPINTFAAHWLFFRHLTRWHLQVKLFK